MQCAAGSKWQEEDGGCLVVFVFVFVFSFLFVFVFVSMFNSRYLIEYVNSHDGKPIGPNTPYLCPEVIWKS